MATQYSNKPIVTDGLVYALDFGNQKSYVSGSAFANNLKYSPLTSSFLRAGNPGGVNVVNNMGEFTINGTTGSYVTLNMPSNPISYGGVFTLCYIGKPKSGDSGYFYGAGDGGNPLIYFSGLEFDSSGYYTGRGFPSNDSLQFITVLHSSGSYEQYINGIPQAPTGFLGGSASPGNPPHLSGRNTSQFPFTGSLGCFLVYNRKLTADEIWQNYQILAPKYGLSVPAKPYTLDPNAYLFLSQSGITDPIITGSINTFVLGLKSAGLWDKMVGIYPFVGTGSVGVNLTGSHRWNLKEPSTATYGLTFTGSWNGSTSGSAPSGSNTNITIGQIEPRRRTQYAASSLIDQNNVHISILSYDTPVSSSYLMGTGMTEDLAISTLAGDYGTPAAAYSVRKVRTAYSGALMDVRRSLDNVTSSIGYVSNGDLDTGSLLTFVGTGPDDHGFVARWYDQSGNSRHASQTTTARQPAIMISGSLVTVLNNKPAIAFNGVNNDITTPSINLSQPTWVFAVSYILDVPFKVRLFTGIQPRVSNFNFDIDPSTFSIFGGDNGITGTRTLGHKLHDTLFNGNSSQIYENSILRASGVVQAGPGNINSLIIGSNFGNPGFLTGSLQELVIHNSNQASNREPIEYGINSYYNIYPQTSSFATSSFTIKADSGSISGSLNNRLTSGIAASGPLGLITVSRTGSNSLTIARNGASTSFTVPASGALSTGLYLGAINNNGIAVGNSPYNISFASVGTGLTGIESTKYYNLVSKLQYDLGRGLLVEGFPAAAAYSVRQLSKTAQYSMEVRRDWDNASSSFGFTSNGDLDTGSLLAFVTGSAGTGSGFVKTWYDQSGNNKHATQSVAALQPLILRSGSIFLENGKPAITWTATSTPAAQGLTAGSISSTATTYSILYIKNTKGGVNNWVLNFGTVGGNYLDKQSGLEFYNPSGPVGPPYFSSSTQTLVEAYLGPTQTYYGNNTLLSQGTAFTSVTMPNLAIGGLTGFGYYSGSLQELIISTGNSLSSRGPITQNINSYFNIY
jgi:hypothetical protein